MNIWSNSCPLRDIRLRNLSDLDVHLSRSFKVKCNGHIGLPIYVFVLMLINSNIWPNSGPLRDISYKALKSEWRFLRSKINMMLPLDSPYMFPINVLQDIPSFGCCRHINLRNVSSNEFDPSRSPKAKCDGGIGLPMYGLMLYGL